jgi:hypothetical protein
MHHKHFVIIFAAQSQNIRKKSAIYCDSTLAHHAFHLHANASARERVFSQAGLIIRPNMQVSTVKVHASSAAQLLFLKCNKKLI